MKPGERLAELYARWGRIVFEHEGTFWMNIDRGSRVMVPVLDHVDLNLTPEQGDHLLRERRCALVRYLSTQQAGRPAGAYVCTDRTYDFAHMTKRMRNYVRRGLESCQIRRLGRRELEEQGLLLNQDTDGKHGRQRREFCDSQEWKRTVDAIFATPGAFAVGAYVGERLASYEVACVDQGWAYAVIQMSRLDLLEHYPNHALYYWFNKHVFENPAIHSVCIGPVPLRGNPGIHNFKVRIGFEVLPRNTVLRVHPLAAPLVTSRLASVLARQAKRLPGLEQRLEGLDILVTGSRISAHREAAPASLAGLTQQETEA